MHVESTARSQLRVSHPAIENTAFASSPEVQVRAGMRDNVKSSLLAQDQVSTEEVAIHRDAVEQVLKAIEVSKVRREVVVFFEVVLKVDDPRISPVSA